MSWTDPSTVLTSRDWFVTAEGAYLLENREVAAESPNGNNSAEQNPRSGSIWATTARMN